MNSTNPFKPGDYVVCIDPAYGLEYGKIYKVEGVNVRTPGIVDLVGIFQGLDESRLQLVDPFQLKVYQLAKQHATIERR